MTKKNLMLLTAVFLLVSTAAFGAEWPSTTALKNLHAERETSILDDGVFSTWSLFHSETMDSPVYAAGSPIAISEVDAVSQILSLVNSSAEYRELTRTGTNKHSRSFFVEYRNGLPVLTGRLELVYDRAGELSRWSLRDYSQWPALDSHLLTLEHSAALLANPLGYRNWSINPDRSFTAWYPDFERRSLRPVYWIRIEGAEPHERWVGIIDAVSGEVISDWPGIQTETISGSVSGPYWQPYDHSETQVAPHAFQLILINANSVVTDTDGSFSHETGQTADLLARLRGPYVHVQNEDVPDDVQLTMSLEAPYDSTALAWTIDDASRPELNLFHHTMLIKLWYADLDPGFDALDYPLPAIANVGTGYDNAFWNGYGTYYGSGGQYNNFAMYSDVIYHEYTHGVTDGIYPDGMLPYVGQSGSLNEAWSDYFACTINGDPLMAEWIGGQPGGEFRDLESELVYHGVDVEVHADSPYISAPLWRIRGQLGAEYTDALAHFARYALAETYIDYLIAVLETDDDDNDLSNGTPNGQIIYNAFGRHGIGPGDEPNFVVDDVHYVADGSGNSSGNGNRFIEPGETADLNFRLTNDVILFPPPATDVQVNITTDNPLITVQNGSHTIPIISPAQSVTIESVLLEVDPSAEDTWVIVTIDIIANGGAVSDRITFEFTVGTPHLLIVQDDAESDVEDFVTGTIRNQNRIFDTIKLTAGSTLPSEYLPHHGMILWLSGNAQGSVLTSEDQWMLRDFIAAGNKVVLSGQYLARGLVGTVFAQNTLQVEILEEPTGIRRITATDTPFEEGEWYMLAGAGGASNQLEMTVFEPLGSSRTVGYYGFGESLPAMIEFQNGSGLLMGFGIEAVSDATHLGNIDRAGFTQRLYDWAGDLLPAEELLTPAAIPNEWSLGPAFPNPFNAVTRIPYVVPTIAKAEYLIYDILGRQVAFGTLTAKSGAIHWQHDGPSGLYFLRTSWRGGHSAMQKLVLLK